ncbi:hypothetical protein SPRG_04650 [Saprolegnia parasitica CBS 223.65]|uniref:EGF-like domain-containing protein n=1 Tax=Saprolegnia parasitica (strain CBS 223.65) TaxID=695850 RepID=A0A067CJ55_SAPPC|nr:hypothetical protein SPRG_04650 [Saprolegnia parasitica CBS 223.65]KDO30749.1 hypothetical protein SPRG_04650 [Saprolegnia parasitica CBS 223.65]|eukprot:XP_012198449.1 hypothetical protein SPRG_04650 [Saprolegnia parasitica CBS 223.65]
MQPLLRIFAVAAAMASMASAECPGGCSGNGVCGPRDMCTCFKNFMGNDCALRICPFGFAHVDTPKGDINMDRVMNSGGTILLNSQMYPGGTYEWTKPTAVADEAHFYMECSNEGICDRATGLCVCYPGYEGSACQRAKCPNACNNRGVCKSMAQVAANGDRSLSITGNPKGNVKTAYTLWDADAGYQCVCDPGFEGPDCSKRSCKVGVDPLYEAAGYPIYETFNIIAAALPTTASQYAGLDQGESYLTPRIPISAEAGATNVGGTTFTKVFQALPNKVFSSISCYSKDYPGYVNTIPALSADEDGFYVTCQYTDNPGPIRLPEVVASAFVDSTGTTRTSTSRAFVTANNRRGEAIDFCATATSAYYASVAANTITVTGTSPPIPALSVIKINDRLTIATLVAGLAITTVWPVPSAGMTAGATVYYATGLAAVADACQIAAWAVGSNSFSCAVAPTAVVGSKIMYQNAIYYVRSITPPVAAVVVAAEVTYTTANSSYRAAAPEILAAPAVITVDRNFNGMALNGLSVTSATETFYILTPTATPAPGTYTYVSQCSGRGLCDFATGLCQCFKGYTNDNCDTQNILAF